MWKVGSALFRDMSTACKKCSSGNEMCPYSSGVRISVVILHARTGLMEMKSVPWVSLERGSTVL